MHSESDWLLYLCERFVEDSVRKTCQLSQPLGFPDDFAAHFFPPSIFGVLTWVCCKVSWFNKMVYLNGNIFFKETRKWLLITSVGGVPKSKMFDVLSWAASLCVRTYFHFHAVIAVALSTYQYQQSHAVIYGKKAVGKCILSVSNIWQI